MCLFLVDGSTLYTIVVMHGTQVREIQRSYAELRHMHADVSHGLQSTSPHFIPEFPNDIATSTAANAHDKSSGGRSPPMLQPHDTPASPTYNASANASSNQAAAEIMGTYLQNLENALHLCPANVSMWPSNASFDSLMTRLAGTWTSGGVSCIIFATPGIDYATAELQ